MKLRIGIILALLLLVGCFNNTKPKIGAALLSGEALWVSTTDFTTASYSAVELQNNQLTIYNDLASAGAIAPSHWARYHAASDVIYLINQFPDINITRLKGENPSQVLGQYAIPQAPLCSSAASRNPQDIAVISDSLAYLSLYGSNQMLGINPLNGQVIGRYDLNAFLQGDPDGCVEAQRLFYWPEKQRLFIVLQRLNRQKDFNPDKLPGLLVVFDVAKQQFIDVNPSTPTVDGIELSGQNPVALHYDQFSQRLLVSQPGCLNSEGICAGRTNQGGLEWVNPENFTTSGLFARASELGGAPGAVITVAGSKIYVVAGAQSQGLQRIELTPNTPWPVAGNSKALAVESPFIQTLALDSQERLWVPVRTSQQPGLVIVDTFTDEVNPSRLNVGLPPLVVLDLQGN